MKRGHELSLRSKFNLGQRISYNSQFFGTIICVMTTDTDTNPKVQYQVRWDDDYKVISPESWVAEIAVKGV